MTPAHSSAAVPRVTPDARTSGQLHDAGHTKEDMRAALIKIPVLQGALAAVELAKKNGAELRCLSDANEYYIGWILEALGMRATRLGGAHVSLRQCRAARTSPRGERISSASGSPRMDAGIADAFTIVVTNVASTDDSGRVRILPYQPLDVPHGCRFCPANLCKVPLRACQSLARKPCRSLHALQQHAFAVVPQGAVMDRWLAEFGDARPRCIYVGDGEGARAARARAMP